MRFKLLATGIENGLHNDLYGCAIPWMESAMKVFVTGVNGQLGHDVMNELAKRNIDGVGSDLKPVYSGIEDGSAVMQSADSVGRFCGAKRTRCGASGLI